MFFQFVSRHRKAKRPDSEKQKDLTPDVLTGISIDLRVPASFFGVSAGTEKQKDLTPDVLTGISINLRVPA